MILNKILTVRIVLIVFGLSSFFNLNGQSLSEYKWKNRILIVKTTKLKSKKYREQLNEFKTSIDEFISRKFILFTITGDDVFLEDYKSSKLSLGKLTGKFNEDIFNEKENFEVLVIGLDGGVKLRRTEVFSKDDLFQMIDSMPMRREELNRNKGHE